MFFLTNSDLRSCDLSEILSKALTEFSKESKDLSWVPVERITSLFQSALVLSGAKFAKSTSKKKNKYLSLAKKYTLPLAQDMAVIDCSISRLMRSGIIPYLFSWTNLCILLNKGEKVSKEIRDVVGVNDVDVDSANDIETCKVYIENLSRLIKTLTRKLEAVQDNYEETRRASSILLIPYLAKVNLMKSLGFISIILLILTIIVTLFLGLGIGTVIGLASCASIYYQFNNKGVDRFTRFLRDIYTNIKADKYNILTGGKESKVLSDLRFNVNNFVNIKRELDSTGFASEITSSIVKISAESRLLERECSNAIESAKDKIRLLQQRLRLYQELDVDNLRTTRKRLEDLPYIESETDKKFIVSVSMNSYTTLGILQEFSGYMRERIEIFHDMLCIGGITNSRAKIFNILSNGFNKRLLAMIGVAKTEIDAISVVEYLNRELGKIQSFLGSEIVLCVCRDNSSEVYDFAISAIRMMDAICKIYNLYVLPVQNRERGKLEENIKMYIEDKPELIELCDVKYIDIFRAIRNDLSIDSYSHEELFQFYDYLNRVLYLKFSNTYSDSGKEESESSNGDEIPKTCIIREDILDSIIENSDIVLEFIDNIEGEYGSRVIKVSLLFNFVVVVLGGSVEQQNSASNHYNVKIPAILEGSNMEIFAHTVCFPHGKQEQNGLKTISKLRKFIESMGLNFSQYRELIERNKAMIISKTHAGTCLSVEMSKLENTDEITMIPSTTPSDTLSPPGLY